MDCTIVSQVQILKMWSLTSVVVVVVVGSEDVDKVVVVVSELLLLEVVEIGASEEVVVTSTKLLEDSISAEIVSEVLGSTADEELGRHSYW